MTPCKLTLQANFLIFTNSSVACKFTSSSLTESTVHSVKIKYPFPWWLSGLCEEPSVVPLGCAVLFQAERVTCNNKGKSHVKATLCPPCLSEQPWQGNTDTVPLILSRFVSGETLCIHIHLLCGQNRTLRIFLAIQEILQYPEFLTKVVPYRKCCIPVYVCDLSVKSLSDPSAWDWA